MVMSVTTRDAVAHRQGKMEPQEDTSMGLQLTQMPTVFVVAAV